MKNVKITNVRVEKMVEAGLAIALATVLSLIKVFEMPQGGSITAASMLPIIFYSIRWGIKDGLLVGMVYGLVQFLVDPYFLTPLQFLLDYIFAYGALALAGVIHNKKFGLANIFLATALAMLMRTLSHVLAGVLFFAEYAGDQNPWIYSIVYNLSYMIPEIIITSFAIYFLYKPLSKALDRK